MENEILKNDEIVSKGDMPTASFSASYDTSTRKYYIVLARGGHCGRGYFIPIIFRTVAYNAKEAVEKSKIIPRVKHDQSGGIITVQETNFLEFMLIGIINDWDPYLLTSDSYTQNIKDSRRVRSPLYIEKVNKAILNSEHSRSYLSENDYIKVSSDYSEDYPLQRATAPFIDNKGLYIFPKRIDLHSVLKEYYNVCIKNVIVPKILEGERLIKEADQARLNGQEISEEKLYNLKKYTSGYNIHLLQAVLIYYKLYGKNNPLGIVYDKYQHEVRIIDSQNYDFIKLKIPQGGFKGRPIGINNPRLTFFNENPDYPLECMIFSNIYPEVYGSDDVNLNSSDNEAKRTSEEVKASGINRIDKFNARLLKKDNTK